MPYWNEQTADIESYFIPSPYQWPNAGVGSYDIDIKYTWPNGPEGNWEIRYSDGCYFSVSPEWEFCPHCGKRLK